jgi:hypothetical protein
MSPQYADRNSDCLPIGVGYCDEGLLRIRKSSLANGEIRFRSNLLRVESDESVGLSTNVIGT